MGDRLDGLITKGRFCLTRRCENALKLRAQRTYAPKTILGQRSGRENNVAGAVHEGGAPRWSAPLGPGVSAPPALGERSASFSSERGGERCR
jgi:hypothetical protein